MIYGLGFKMGVLESLSVLNSAEEKEYTVNQVLNCFIEIHSLNPSEAYKQTLYKRVWHSLNEWSSEGYCQVEHKTHPDRNVLIGYYKML